MGTCGHILLEVCALKAGSNITHTFSGHYLAPFGWDCLMPGLPGRAAESHLNPQTRWLSEGSGLARTS